MMVFGANLVDLFSGYSLDGIKEGRTDENHKRQGIKKLE